MKKILSRSALASLMALGLTNVYADDALASYMPSLTTFLPTFQKNADKIWPGFQVDTKPLIIMTDSSVDDGLYVLNFLPQNSAWQKQVFNDVPVYYLQHDSIGVHDYHSTLNNPYFSLENQAARVSSFDDFMGGQEENNKLSNFSLALSYFIDYELLDSPNAKTKRALLEQLNTVHDGFNKPDNLALLFLQAVALKDYLKTNNEEALKNYAALFQSRYQSLDNNSQVFEVIAGEPLVWNYVAYKATSKNDADFVKQMMSQYIEGGSYLDFIEEDYDLSLNFIHMAVEFGLDKVEPTWKKAVESSNTPPSVLLQQHYHFSDKEIATRVEMAKTQYGYADILTRVNNLLTPYLNEMQNLQTQYQQNDGVEFVLHLPVDHDESHEGHAGAQQYIINSQETLYTSATSLSESSSDGAFNFYGKNVPLYFTATNYVSLAESIDEIKFKIPAQTKLVVDGREDTVGHFVDSNESVEFNQLVIAGSDLDALSIDLTVSAPGYTLVAVNGQLQIVLPKKMQNQDDRFAAKNNSRQESEKLVASLRSLIKLRSGLSHKVLSRP